LDVIKLTVSTGTESTLVLTTDYTVSLNGDQNSNPGGTVTLTAGALASGFTLTITSNIANLQPTDLTNQGGFYPEVITDSLDRATIQIQQIADIGDRTLKIPISDGTLNMELPTKTERANTFLSFDANGLPSVVTAGSSGAPATITRQVFSGTGSQTAFTLASDPGALGNSAQVYIGGVYQQRSTYTIAGTTLTFSAAPVAGTDNIEFVNFLTSNIGATSADLVTYTPSGTSAVARSAASKFGETVSVKDFGAVGNGVADDTAAIQAAIAHAQQFGGTVTFPGPATYLANLTITTSIPGASFGVTLDFTAGTFQGTGSPALLPYNQSLPAITLGTSSATAQNVRIVGLTTWGRAGDQRFMLVNSASYCVFDKITIGEFKDYAIRITSNASQGTYFNNFTNCNLIATNANSTCRILELDYGLLYNNACSFNQCHFSLLGACQNGIKCTATAAQMLHWFSNCWIEGGPNNPLREAHVKCTGNVLLYFNNVVIDGTSTIPVLDYDEDNYPGGAVRGAYSINGLFKAQGTLASQQLNSDLISEKAVIKELRVRQLDFSDINITPQITQVSSAACGQIQGAGNTIQVRSTATNGRVILTYGAGGNVLISNDSFSAEATIHLGSGGPRIISGAGTPEAVVTAPIGSLFLRSDGGAGTTLYVKESGAGNTGWIAK
jgi:hypothetical protein